MKIKHILHFVLPISMVLVFSACQVGAPIKQTPSPYVSYVSPKELGIYLEFRYPQKWLLSERKVPETDITFITLNDPRFASLPTPFPEEPHPFSNDYGVINIIVQPSQFAISAEEIKQRYSLDDNITLRKTYETSINGYASSVLEYRINPTEDGPPSAMFNRRIFFIVNNYFCEIHFTVSEKDRGGEFEKGYEYLFNSLKIMP